MVRLRLIVLAVFAAFAVSALASATASASKGEFVKQSNKTGLVKGQFTATSGETLLETKSGTKIACKTDVALGTITSATGGEQTVRFKTCTSSAIACKSITPSQVGASGEVIVLTELKVEKMSLGDDTVANTILNAGTKTAGTLHIECSGIQIQVQGGFYGNAIPVNTKTAALSVALTATGGVKVGLKAGEQKVLTNEAGEVKHLEAKIEAGVFEAASQEGTETLHLLEEGEFV